MASASVSEPNEALKEVEFQENENNPQPDRDMTREELRQHANRPWDTSLAKRKQDTDDNQEEPKITYSIGNIMLDPAAQRTLELHEQGHLEAQNKLKKSIAEFESDESAARDTLEDLRPHPQDQTIPPPIMPDEDEYLDADTNEMVRTRTIGAKINVDNDDIPGDKPVKSFAEYAERENAKSEAIQEPTPRVYMAQHPQFDELQDLGPGE
jgi:hypothetical protein